MARPKKLNLGITDKEIEEMFKEVAQEVVGEFNYQMRSMYEKAIYVFYADYKPKYYDRTESLLEANNLYDNPDKTWNVDYNRANQIVSGGLFVDPKYIKGNPYRADKDWVFNRSYKKGIHGHTFDEKRHFGVNDWWDKFLRTIHPGRYIDVPRYKVNQYKLFRYIAKNAGTRATKDNLVNNYLDLLRWMGVERSSQASSKGSDDFKIKAKPYNTKFLFTVSQDYRRYHMRGSTPEEIVQSFYVHLSSKRSMDSMISKYITRKIAKR